ncbi:MULTISPECIES: hypothetical protein [Pantoea]|uniref:hypothetical protein n=1 Tax=Pantoea TaxID=53335 RepID=UPI000B501DD9|nr:MULTISPECIES: hypothetical protein [Pantoea]MBS0900048.1 hypothetical protein [Pantoea dispersa]MCW0323757.1 hypothetical protein [Pantoea dispersa]MCW0328493.1 hypothetical protein [Pantoea dispersa]MCW0434918.1 hypothetical protein [Pantoea dispersa]OWS76603.1 hypothetical protein CBW22_05910 [Pantoea sp. VS1]
MATMTRIDISNDVNMLMQNLEDKNRPLVSPAAALKLSMTWPVACVMGYVLALLWMAYSFTPEQDLFGNNVYFSDKMQFEMFATGITVLSALGVGASLYNSALVYLSFDENTRNNSFIINRIRKLTGLMGLGAVIVNWGVALVGAVIEPKVIGISTLVFLLSILVIQMVISAELTRYGIAGAMSKLARLIKKI